DAETAYKTVRQYVQEYDDNEVDDDLADARNDRLHLRHRRKGLQDAEQEACRDGARQRAHAADHDHHEGDDEEIHAERVVRRKQRRVHDAGHACDDRRNAEHDGEAPIDVDAEDADRLAVSHAGTHDHAEGGELQEGEHSTDHRSCEKEVYEAPPWIGDHAGPHAEPGADVGCAAQSVGHRLWMRVGAEERLDQFTQHDGEAEGDEDLLGVRPLIEMLDDAAFHGNAHEEHHGNADEKRYGNRIVDEPGAEVPEPCLYQRFANLHRLAPWRQLCRVDRDRFQRQEIAEGHGAERAKHEQGTVGEVHDPQRAEDERQAKGNQRVGAALVQPIKKLQKDDFK